MVTDAEQEARDEYKRQRASPKVDRLNTLSDGTAPAGGEDEFNQVVWTRHHWPERAEAEGEPVLVEPTE